MSKLTVVNEEDGTRFPFLRGILVKSLQLVGLEFADAYRISTDVRDEMEENEEITTTELRKKIDDLLKVNFPGIALSQYKKEPIPQDNVHVASADGSSEPFSRATHLQRLQSCAIPAQRCHAITREIHARLVINKVAEISSQQLTSLTYEKIKKSEPQQYADYYLIWRDFLKNSYPLLLFIGGVPGCGKSTVATEIANRLGIVRTQSTDMLREVMRILIPEKLSPFLHTSSFYAGRAMQISDLYNNPDAHLLYGFQMQTEMVEVACEAVVQRAINENVSMILEGVHIRPSLVTKISVETGVVVPVNLAVLNKDRLIKFIKGRSKENKQRRAQRYLSSLNEIWKLQKALLSEADNADMAIIDNNDIDETSSEIISIIIKTIASGYKDKITELREKYS